MARKKKETEMSNENEAAAVEETPVEATEATEGAAATGIKRPKKLTKAIEGTEVVITVIGVEGEMRFDAASLSESIQNKLIPFGLGHKLGDAAAGREGLDAKAAIEKVWDGLMKEDWSVRAPAAPKVNISDVKKNLANLSPEEQEKAKALLAQMFGDSFKF